MRKALAGLLMLGMLACVFVPSVRFTEDRDTVQLARTIYALGKTEAYETKLALGTVVMNRVASGWFPNDLGGVLRDQQQFPAGNRYDEESLRAAHELISGRRTLSPDALYYHATRSAQRWQEENCEKTLGGYGFYTENGNI